jgi:hypothetical protein
MSADLSMSVSIEQLHQRSRAERSREHKYRCAQALVFGLPVLGLQWFGHHLGGPEAARWVAVIQALLAGWVMYVSAAGMLMEGLLLPGRQTLPDSVVSAVSVVIYLASLCMLLPILAGGTAWAGPWFHWPVILLAAWCGGQWRRLSVA